MILLLLATAALATAGMVGTAAGLARDGYRAAPTVPCRVPERPVPLSAAAHPAIRPPHVFAAARRVRVHAQM